ncbi:MAG: hypothetical protein R6U96_18695 [Promethearchaeia archaeon]
MLSNEKEHQTLKTGENDKTQQISVVCTNCGLINEIGNLGMALDTDGHILHYCPRCYFTEFLDSDEVFKHNTDLKKELAQTHFENEYHVYCRDDFETILRKSEREFWDHIIEAREKAYEWMEAQRWKEIEIEILVSNSEDFERFRTEFADLNETFEFYELDKEYHNGYTKYFLYYRAPAESWLPKFPEQTYYKKVA